MTRSTCRVGSIPSIFQMFFSPSSSGPLPFLSLRRGSQRTHRSDTTDPSEFQLIKLPALAHCPDSPYPIQANKGWLFLILFIYFFCEGVPKHPWFFYLNYLHKKLSKGEVPFFLRGQPKKNTIYLLYIVKRSRLLPPSFRGRGWTMHWTNINCQKIKSLSQSQQIFFIHLIPCGFKNQKKRINEFREKIQKSTCQLKPNVLFDKKQ